MTRVGSLNSIQGSGYHTPVENIEGSNEGGQIEEYGSEFPSELGALCVYTTQPQNQVI